MNSKKVNHLVLSSLIAALYAVLTISMAPMGYGQFQLRVAEAMTILPFFSYFPIPGLFIGCIIANLASGFGIVDIVFGSLATLLAGIATYYIGKSNLPYKKILAPLPPVIINALVVGAILKYTANLPFIPSVISVGIGEALSCYLLGLMLLSLIERNKGIKKYFTD